MIYWPTNSERVTKFPNAAGYAPTGNDPALWLEVYNNVNLLCVSGGFEPDEVTPLYITKTFGAEELPEGEYTYSVKYGSGGQVLSCGLIIVGDYTPDRTEFEKTIEYEQYGS